MAAIPTEIQQRLVRYSEVHFYCISLLPTVSEQERPHLYQVTLRRVRFTIAAAEKEVPINIVSVCPHSCLSYRACKPHLFCIALCCHMSPVRFDNTFPRYHVNGTIFGKQLSSATFF